MASSAITARRALWAMTTLATCAAGCAQEPEDLVCTARLQVRAADPALLEQMDAAHVIIMRDGVQVFSRELDLAGGAAGATLELKDVDTAGWPEIDASAVFRALLTGFSKANREVVAVGRSFVFGCEGSGEAEVPIYLGAADGFIDTAAGLSARLGATATPLLDGRVLVFGGEDAAGDAASPAALIYDQWFGGFCGPSDAGCMQGQLPPARIEHSATLLPDGDVLIVGGRQPGTQQLLSDATRFEAASSRFSALPGGLSPRARHAAVLLEGAGTASSRQGQVLLVGGWGGDAAPALLDDAVLIDPASGAVTAVPGAMSTPRQSASATRLRSGEVIIAGGRDAAAAPLGSIERYSAQEGSFDASAAFTLLRARRAEHTATLMDDGNLLLWGGEVAPISAGDTPPNAEVLFTDMQSRPLDVEQVVGARRGHSATRIACASPPCPVLLAGGIDETGAVAAAWLFSSAETHTATHYRGSVEPRDVGLAATDRHRHSAAALDDGTVLLLGGLTSSGAARGDAVVFSLCEEPEESLNCPAP